MRIGLAVGLGFAAWHGIRFTTDLWWMMIVNPEPEPLGLTFAELWALSPTFTIALWGPNFVATGLAAQHVLRLRDGADPNAKTDRGQTPLHDAAAGGHTEAITTLLNAGADPNAKTERGQTPLHFAAGRGHTEVIATLLGAGADSNAKDRSGETPRQIALSRGHAEAAALLE